MPEMHAPKEPSSGPDQLVRAKLRPPQPLRPLVRREGLEARLRGSVTDARVVLVQGPSGTGKTALLTDWFAAETRSVSWLSIDIRDNDPARFWSHVARSLAGASGVGFRGPGPDEVPVGSDLFVDALIDEVTAAGDPWVLVLDELEHITNPQLHQQLDLLIAGCGDRLTTVVASRVRPPLRLDKLQIAGRLALFTWADLQMSHDEAERVFQEGFGLRLPRDRIATLVQATDGWASGLAFMGATMRTNADAVFEGTLPSGSSDALADHLVDHVWRVLPLEIREFLLDTAVLERFSVPLADAVHHAGDADDILSRLLADGVFVLRDHDRPWFRYQRLFRWALARRLSALDPPRERAAHRSAARWFADNGDREDAIEHALLGGDHQFAAEMLDDVFESYAAAGRVDALERWLQSLPDDAVAVSGESLTDRALALWCTLGRTDERDRWSMISGRVPSAKGPTRPSDVWQLCVPRERGELALALRNGREFVSRMGVGMTSPLTATQARISTARSLLLAGRADECWSLLADVDRLWPEGRPPAQLRLVVHALLGLACFRGDDLETARAQARLAGRARAACPAPPRPRAVPEYVILRAALAARDDEHGDVEHLRDLVEASPGLGPDHSLTVFALLVLARSYGARPDGALAAERVAAADALLTSFPSALGLVDFRNDVAASTGEPIAAHDAAELLSERELAVLQYLRSDLSLREIADHLYISVNTVKTHTRHIYRKLGMTGRHQVYPFGTEVGQRPPSPLTRGQR